MVRIALVSLLAALVPTGRGTDKLDYAMDLWQPEVVLVTALGKHNSKAVQALLAPRFVFESEDRRAAGGEGAAAMQEQYGAVPTGTRFSIGAMPVTVVHGRATLARSLTTPFVSGMATKYRWRDTWQRVGTQWKLASVKSLPQVTLEEPRPHPDDPAIRAELQEAYAAYFKALETHDAALFRTVTLPTYSSILEPNERNYTKTGDPMTNRMRALEPLGDVHVDFRKLFVNGVKAVAVVEHVTEIREKPVPKTPKEFRITGATFTSSLKDTWVRTKEGWKLAKEESGH